MIIISKVVGDPVKSQISEHGFPEGATMAPRSRAFQRVRSLKMDLPEGATTEHQNRANHVYIHPGPLRPGPFESQMGLAVGIIRSIFRHFEL